jgi:RNA polymerase sigma-70 factor (ECF subfamily)
MLDGEITALLDVSISAGRIVKLRIVTRAAHLQTARRNFGLPAVRQILNEIRERAWLTAQRASVTVCGDFPVDIDA